ncbi:MAG TPA: hypothetical protein VFP20_03855 [Bacteroidales bacterium]|nr:hypothetical protein [Bacteroidales bacterium]
MNWIKKGLIYCPSGLHGFDVSHCHKPTPLILNENTVRVYFGVRDSSVKSRTTFVDLDINDLSKVLYVHDKPTLDLGKIGTFDDSGNNVCSVVRVGDLIYMYFIGWNPSTTVHTRNSIGVAISRDNGLTFERPYDGSILDRTKDEPYYTGAVDVIKDGDRWKMWYTSGSEWKILNGKPEIYYHIKYATSENGIDWQRDNISCIKPKTDLEATARPSVLKDIIDGKAIYRMWYSRRDLLDFRIDKKHDYRAGYAESLDGINWNRLDHQVGIDVSSEGWDSNAIAYPYVIRIKDQLVMFYNGNGFGKTGFGYAVLETEKY